MPAAETLLYIDKRTNESSSLPPLIGRMAITSHHLALKAAVGSKTHLIPLSCLRRCERHTGGMLANNAMLGFKLYTSSEKGAGKAQSVSTSAHLF
jgi:hypothetical protein